MGKDHRVTLNRRHAYRTISNRVKTVRTPGKYSLSSSCDSYMLIYFIRWTLCCPVD